VEATRNVSAIPTSTMAYDPLETTTKGFDTFHFQEIHPDKLVRDYTVNVWARSVSLS
jgi:hypothetical protein